MDNLNNNEAQRESLLRSVGLGSLIKPSKPHHKRTETEISNLSQFENVDEDIEDEQPVKQNIQLHNHPLIKKSPLPTVADNEYGEILKVRK